ncbi:MAG TPA: hypothetical protein VMU05_00720 [Dongiaceae bacterium]|nr:hypothetical protein [Dongiaceae bacterium]
MLFGSEKQGQEMIPLKAAVLCLDCEAITATTGDECVACKGRSLVNLARILGSFLDGNLGTRQGSGRFNVTVTIELQQMHARDLNGALESLTAAIASTLADDRASIHINVQPTVNGAVPTAA